MLMMASQVYCRRTGNAETCGAAGDAFDRDEGLFEWKYAQRAAVAADNRHRAAAEMNRPQDASTSSGGLEPPVPGRDRDLARASRRIDR